eukprot:TRINITY_DN1470_c0_g1_i1.p1 TRINITY_DN1470_c0_g1~~TRINITY_DN1470_c0_g1_i1.p1  ORF type:complete len:242 (-),score=54.27 TRINITY_DN1470_c0_g1_i1:53-724(-)
MRAVILFALFLISQIHGHSMMTCAILDSKTNTCIGAIRSAQQSKQTASYPFDGNNACQQPGRGVANLDGKYPTGSPMGTLESGQKFTVQWMARNHAVANQSPRVVRMHISPIHKAGQTEDYSWAEFQKNNFCTGPFTNCGKGPNVDTTGDEVPCTLECTVPTLQAGNYTLHWYWDWRQNDGKEYMTCADFKVVTPPPLVVDFGPASALTLSTMIVFLCLLFVL